MSLEGFTKYPKTDDEVKPKGILKWAIIIGLFILAGSVVLPACFKL